MDKELLVPEEIREEPNGKDFFNQLNDRRFFFCGQGFARPKKGFCSLEEGDYIDLSKCTGTVEEKEMLLRFCMGYPPKGYISVCRTCYGMGSDNDRIVSVAEQM